MTEPTNSTPRVFISYSHDSPEHKRWVADLAIRLVGHAVDVSFDQWDLGLGDDLARFMEDGVARADRVLVICTAEYNRKADAGKGGVGYEKMIVTAELVNNAGTDKFIPVVRNPGDEAKTPRFLGSRFYVDLTRDGKEYEQEYQRLLRELHKVPELVKPPLGKNPFAQLPSGAEAPRSAGLETSVPVLPQQTDSPSEVYAFAVEAARVGDLVGWRQLVKRVWRPIPASLLAWRQHHEQHPPKNDEEWQAAIDAAVKVMAPMFCIALAGVESGREQFRDQRALVDMLLDIGGWTREGPARLVEAPQTLVFVYQAIYGAICLDTGQLPQAISLVDMKVEDGDRDKLTPIRSYHSLVGWPTTFGHSSTIGWNYLFGGARRWPWLSEIFGGEREYQIALCAYYMALNVHELADCVVSGNSQAVTEQKHTIHVDIPLEFAFTPEEITSAALSLLRRQNALAVLWESLAVPENTVRGLWPDWIRQCRAGLSNWRPGTFLRRLPHEKLFE